MPTGFLLPPPTEPESTIGRIGKIHGERMVTIPARNANAKSKIIVFFLFTGVWEYKPQ